MKPAPLPRRPLLGAGDADLVAAVRAGRPDAFAVIVDRHRPSLLRAARRVLGARRGQVDDVVQDALWRAYLAVRADDRPIDLVPWLHTIVRNRALDELRRERPVAGEMALLRLVARDDASAPVVRREAVGAMVSDVTALPPRQRLALVAHAVDGRSHAGIADELGISVGATKTLVNRARVNLERARSRRDAA